MSLTSYHAAPPRVVWKESYAYHAGMASFFSARGKKIPPRCRPSSPASFESLFNLPSLQGFPPDQAPFPVPAHGTRWFSSSQRRSGSSVSGRNADTVKNGPRRPMRSSPRSARGMSASGWSVLLMIPAMRRFGTVCSSPGGTWAGSAVADCTYRMARHKERRAALRVGDVLAGQVYHQIFMEYGRLRLDDPPFGTGLQKRGAERALPGLGRPGKQAFPAFGHDFLRSGLLPSASA